MLLYLIKMHSRIHNYPHYLKIKTKHIIYLIKIIKIKYNYKLYKNYFTFKYQLLIIIIIIYKFNLSFSD